MGRVTVTEVLTGDTASAANVNATMTSFVNQSTDVDANCVRESGIWWPTIASRACTPTNGRDTFANAGPSAALVTAVSDTEFSVGSTVKVGPIDNSAITDQAIVRFSTAFGLSSTPGTLQIVLAYSTDDSTYTAIEATRRKFNWNYVTINAELGGTITPKGTITIAHRFLYATAGSATLYIKPMYMLSAGTVTFDNTVLMAQVYAK